MTSAASTVAVPEVMPLKVSESPLNVPPLPATAPLKVRVPVPAVTVPAFSTLAVSAPTLITACPFSSTFNVPPRSVSTFRTPASPT